jgi:hypothetical protein
MRHASTSGVPTEKNWSGVRAPKVCGAGDVRKARLLLLLADDQPYTEIQRLLGCSSTYISRWKSGLRAKVWPVCAAGTKVERRLC